MNACRRSRGFTLVELLVVIAIIGILIALLLPAVQAAREASRRSACQNNLKQLALALQNYHDVNKSFPVGHMFEGDLDGDATNNSGGTGFGWAYFILPFMEQDAQFERFNARLWIADPVNIPIAQQTLKAFNCPSDIKPPFATDGAVTNSATSSYQGCGSAYDGWSGNAATANANSLRYNGLFERNNRDAYRLHDILDGTTNTFAIAEGRYRMTAGGTNRSRIYGASDAPGPGTVGASNALMINGEWLLNWTADEGNPQPSRTAASEHPGGSQFALVDGSVRFVRETIAHSATAWVNNASAYRQPNGQPYGVYQRLFSVRDGIPLSDF